MAPSALRLIIISGRSGSGKSTVLNALEDAGFTCIDNLPPVLLPELVGWMSRASHQPNIAVCIDARISPDGIRQLPDILTSLPKTLIPELIYLDAEETILLQRFSATRRKHPLTDEFRSLAEAIAEEGELLAPVADRASLKIDTSSLSLQELRDQVRQRVIHKPKGIALQFVSFGFKHGVPRDADLVFDVRCLPNPYWDKSLRMFTGRDPAIEAFLQREPAVTEMFEDIRRFLDRWVRQYEANQRSYLTVAIGCTGGQHRSVYMAEQLHLTFTGQYSNVQLRHRDMGQDHA
ncbi:RNase adapter RapZ [Saccharospirillum salsuginis]|uniref:Nucleotide-binding protein n=1 Tax=Saccharospirillum salsuginis TaxID=418750 RepID=A0A918KNZ0_9GAMM|nr:RNase adapter RapZ [Saccharospirillum salsuginis]GGX70216.1 nucleotide-binding protein [Saccharospirillum salsuginis]